MYKRRKKSKKLKIKYLFCTEDHTIIGSTDDICRTVTSLWTVFKEKSKEVYLDIDNKSNHYTIRKKTLQLLEKNSVKTYKYLNKSITRNDFLLHLNCDKKKTSENNK